MEALTDAAFLDVLQPDFEFESERVAEARERNWYAHTPLGPMVLRHREAWEVLTDRRLVLGGERYMQMHGVTEGPLYDWWMNVLMSVSVEDHARLRGLVQKAFTPRMVEGLRPFVRATARRLASQFADAREHEFVAGFAEPLPTLVMCEMLGVPVEDYDLFHHCSNDLGLAFSRSLGDLSRIDAAMVELKAYVDDLVARRRTDLGGDLISSLIQAEQDGQRLTPQELSDLLVLLVWAGQDTTARQLGRAVVAFAEHSEQWQLLTERPELAPQAVEEVCRWTPQARTTWRFAAEDLEHNGLAIAEGTMVLVCTVSGNRDPQAFDDPDRFDITRAGKSRQLVFGGGIHFCLGAGAARLEMAEGLLALTGRLGPPQITGEIAWRPPAAVIHGPEVLPLRFGSGDRAAAPSSSRSDAAAP